MRPSIIVLIGSLLIFTSVYSQDKKDINTSQERKNNKDKKHLYTQEEFNNAVLEETRKQLTKIGRYKLVDLFTELLQKEQKYESDLLKLDKERTQVKASITTLETKIKEFEQRQNNFIACVEEVDQAQNDRVVHMVKVLEGMRPANASDVLSVQDTIVAVKLLELLPPDKISKIFNSMDKEISARLQKQYMSMKK